LDRFKSGQSTAFVFYRRTRSGFLVSKDYVFIGESSSPQLQLLPLRLENKFATTHAKFAENVRFERLMLYCTRTWLAGSPRLTGSHADDNLQQRGLFALLTLGSTETLNFFATVRMQFACSCISPQQPEHAEGGCQPSFCRNIGQCPDGT
jgi:hypothetical protein